MLSIRTRKWFAPEILKSFPCSFLRSSGISLAVIVTTFGLLSTSVRAEDNALNAEETRTLRNHLVATAQKEQVLDEAIRELMSQPATPESTALAQELELQKDRLEQEF